MYLFEVHKMIASHDREMKHRRYGDPRKSREIMAEIREYILDSLDEIRADKVHQHELKMIGEIQTLERKLVLAKKRLRQVLLENKNLREKLNQADK